MKWYDRINTILIYCDCVSNQYTGIPRELTFRPFNCKCLSKSVFYYGGMARHCFYITCCQGTVSTAPAVKALFLQHLLSRHCFYSTCSQGPLSKAPAVKAPISTAPAVKALGLQHLLLRNCFYSTCSVFAATSVFCLHFILAYLCRFCN
jgi:hypothetical protein